MVTEQGMIKVLLVDGQDDFVASGRIRHYGAVPGVLRWQGRMFRYSHMELERRVYVETTDYTITEF